MQMQKAHFDQLDGDVRTYLLAQDCALKLEFAEFVADCEGERAPSAVIDPDPCSY